MSEKIDSKALDNLLKTIGGDTQFLRQLIDTFLEDAPGMLQEMVDAAQEKDNERLRLLSHSLKTNSAQFGATALFELCREIELQAKDGELATSKIETAQAEFEGVGQELKNLREV